METTELFYGIINYAVLAHIRNVDEIQK